MNSCAYDPNPNSFDCPPDSYHPPHPTYEAFSGDSCGNNPQFGYDCPPQFPLNYKPEPGYTQNYNSCPHASPRFPQQYPCCDDYRVTHEPYQCQPMNEDYYQEQNFCCDSFGFDDCQPPQYTVNHPIFNTHHEYLDSQKELSTTITKLKEQMTSLTSFCEMTCQIVQNKLEEKQIEEEQAAKAQTRKLLVCYDDDDDEEESNSLKDNNISELPPCSAVTPNEPVNSLSMRDKHLDIIPATESDEVIRSSVENLVPNPSKSEGENGCDVPSCFTTFSNILFDDEYEFDSVDDQSLHNEDFSDKIFSNPLFEEEINSIKKNQHHFNAESDLVESMLNRDSSIISSSSKIDSLLDEFAEIISIKIDQHHFNAESDLVESLLNHDSSIISSSSKIDSLLDEFAEIDLFLTPDGPMPPSIEDDDDDSERDVLILEELLDNYSLSLPDKSPDLLSQWGLEIFKLSTKCPMMIHGKNIPILDVSLFHFYPLDQLKLTLRHRDTVNATAGGIFMKRRPEECYDLIENMIAHHNDWDTSVQRTTIGQTQNVYAAGAYNQGGEQPRKKPILPMSYSWSKPASSLSSTSLSSPRLPSSGSLSPNSSTMNTASSSGSRTLPSNTITNPKEDLKGITTRSEIAYKGPMIPTTSSPPKVVERETEVTKDTPVVALVVEPIKAPVSDLKPNPNSSNPYPSRLHDQKLRDKANDQKEKFFQIFQDLNFNISFADALILMPKFGLTIKSFFTNKDKLFELARTPLNEHCSAVLLKKLPEKLGDPGKFLIPCDFPGMDECLALADVGASINLIPLSIRHALIDVYEGELTLHVGKEAVIFNLDQTSRYSSNYDDMSINQNDIIDVACEEYSQEVFRFSVSGNPTPSTEPIVSTSCPTLTIFGDSDFLLEETDAFLAIEDEPISSEIDNSYYDSKGDILLLKEFLNDDPSLLPLPLH
nr:reverse transcriptase domain-containing protein [Tanacetum cinerariifolium]